MRSKPKQNEDNGQVEAAVAKLKDARRFDDSKQYSTAVMLYEEGLRLLIERHQQESDEPKRAVILKTVEEYMARAERCKQLAPVKPPDHTDPAQCSKQQNEPMGAVSSTEKATLTRVPGSEGRPTASELGLYSRAPHDSSVNRNTGMMMVSRYGQITSLSIGTWTIIWLKC